MTNRLIKDAVITETLVSEGSPAVPEHYEGSGELVCEPRVKVYDLNDELAAIRDVYISNMLGA